MSEREEANHRPSWPCAESRRSVWDLPGESGRVFAGARPRAPMGYGVIGSPTDSGSVSLGSSPGTPATRANPHEVLVVSAVLLSAAVLQRQVLAPSSSGPGRRPLKAVAWVRIP